MDLTISREKMDRRLKYFLNSIALMIVFLLLAIIYWQAGIYQKTLPEHYWLAILFFTVAVAFGLYGVKVLFKEGED